MNTTYYLFGFIKIGTYSGMGTRDDLKSWCRYFVTIKRYKCICPNCNIDMDIKQTPRMNEATGKVELQPKVVCGICSYGWFVY